MKSTDRTLLKWATTWLIVLAFLLSSHGCAPKDPKIVAYQEGKRAQNTGDRLSAWTFFKESAELGCPEAYQSLGDMVFGDYKSISGKLPWGAYLSFIADKKVAEAQKALDEAARHYEKANLAGLTNENLSACQMKVVAEKKRIADMIANHPIAKDERVAFLAKLEKDMIDIPYEKGAISGHEILIPRTILEKIRENAHKEGYIHESIYFLHLLNAFPELRDSRISYGLADTLELPSEMVPKCVPWVNKEDLEAMEEMRKEYNISGFRLVRPRSLSNDEIAAFARKTKGLVDGIAADMVEIAGEIPGREYAICKYEVTQALWESFMGYNPSEEKGRYNPVENVSFDECKLFLKRLNMSEKFNARLEKRPARNYRFPTADEWEYACLAKSCGKYCKLADGTDIDEDTLQDVAWRGSIAPQPVGKKKPNAFGLYDMLGNVWEWTSTIGRYEYSNEDCQCALRRNWDDYRVICGGSYSTPGSVERVDMLHLGLGISAGNHYSMPHYKADSDVGFRLAADKIVADLK